MMVPKGAGPRHLPLYITLFILSACILSVLAGCSISTPSLKRETSLHPPFKKVWEFRPSSRDDQFNDHIIKGDTFYYATGSGYGAVDLRTGKAIWEAKFPAKGYPVFLAMENDTLALSVSNWALIHCDPSDGRIRWSMPMPGEASPILINEKRLFFESPQGEFECMDIETNKIVWSRPIGIPKLPDSCKRDLGYLSGRPLIVGSTVFIGRDYGEILAIDCLAGSLRWRTMPQSDDCASVIGFANDAKRLFCTLSRGQVQCLDIESGEVLWSSKIGWGIDYAPVVHGDLLIYSGHGGDLIGLNKSIGSMVWRRTIGSMGTTSQPCAGSEGITIVGKTSLCLIDYAGDTLWEWGLENRPAFEMRIQPYKSGYLACDAIRLFHVVMGISPTDLPVDLAGRKTLAEQLVARIDKLNDREERTLVMLGEPAVEALIKIFKDYLSYQGDIRNNPELYEQFHAAYFPLNKLITPSHTPLLLELLEKAEHSPPSGRDLVLNLLADCGNDIALPALIAEIKNSKKTITEDGYEEYSGGYYQGIRFLLQSRHPEAVGFLIRRLNDPNAEPELRHKAFLALPKTGGAAGLEAVLKAKDHKLTIPPLAEFMHLDQLDRVPLETARADYDAEHNSFLKSRLLEEQFDDHGQKWGLVQSSALGSGDLWIVKWDGQHWTEPIFTGVDLEKHKFDDWVRAYAQDAALKKDTDNDGWTDLIEGRLGTDAVNPDTDGDGLTDSQDRNPLAAAAPEGETQEILAAAFEAAYRFYGWRPVPCIVEMPEGVEPFELSGWEWIILSKRHGAKLPLDAIERRGVGLIDFDLPRRDFVNDTLQKYRNGEVILWNKDRTEAKVHVVRYFGMLDAEGDDVHLKKFGKNWVAIEVKPIWAS